MPRGDGSGPMGAGPMTGRAAGYCAGYGVPGYMNPAGGRGMGWRRGRGFGGGFGRGWVASPGMVPAYPPVDAPVPVPPRYDRDVPVQDELGALKSQADYMARSLEAINERIGVLEARSSDENSE